jgi:high-affinity iron transporter
LGIDVKHSVRLTSIILISSGLFSSVTASSITASSLDPAQVDPALTGELIRANLASARVDFSFDLPGARALTRDAKVNAVQLAKNFEPNIAKQIASSFALAETAIQSNNERTFTRATAHAWTALLEGAYRKLEKSVTLNDSATARKWLSLREYRQATRFTPPEADATLALENLALSKISSQDALKNIRADVLDAYQSRLNESLSEFERNLERGFKNLASENAAFASGYFGILAPFYPTNTLENARATFATLELTPSLENLKLVHNSLEAWRAAPLSDRERNKRAVQTLRFLALVPVEYARGVKVQDGRWAVVKDLEITEASVFLNGAASAFTDLEPLLVDRDVTGVPSVTIAFKKLQAQVSATASKTTVTPSDDLRSSVEALTTQVETVIPTDWRRQDAAADLDVIRSQLRQLENAAAQAQSNPGDYELVESARINAYAILESGTEARIKFFQPQLAQDIEGMFWNGLEPKGFARLISERAAPSEFKTTRVALEVKLAEAARYVGTEASPVAAFVNAFVIVFREGLEAVLILAALLGSLKAPAVRHLRRPLWMGAAASFVATIITFMVMSRILNAFAVFGEKLEAIVSVIAVAVLLVIMNWFFHNVYWNDHLANFHKKKHSLMGANVGQGIGLMVLGFTAMYREGFETVLFMQSLVLQSGTWIVVGGASLALVLVSLVGMLVFVMQTKLPHKKMLIATGGMICVVLFVIVGNTTHLLQVVGWMPIHPLPVAFPYWSGLWLGTYATLEGIALQVISVTFVIGSYFVAEGLKRHELNRKLEAQGEPMQRAGKPELGKLERAQSIVNR